MAATNATQWFWSDWAGDPAVRRLNPDERGIWIDLLALAAVGNPTGYVCDDKGRPIAIEEIGRFTNCPDLTRLTDLINGIVDKGAASRDRTGRLFNRRMVRKSELSARRSLAGKKGGDSTRLKWQEFNRVPQQLPRGLPQQRVSSLTNKKITTTESGTAREESGQPNGDVSPELASILNKRRA